MRGAEQRRASHGMLTGARCMQHRLTQLQDSADTSSGELACFRVRGHELPHSGSARSSAPLTLDSGWPSARRPSRAGTTLPSGLPRRVNGATGSRRRSGKASSTADRLSAHRRRWSSVKIQRQSSELRGHRESDEGRSAWLTHDAVSQQYAGLWCGLGRQRCPPTPTVRWSRGIRERSTRQRHPERTSALAICERREKDLLRLRRERFERLALLTINKCSVHESHSSLPRRRRFESAGR